MARKNSLKVSKKRNQSLLDRAKQQQDKLDKKKQRKQDIELKKMPVEEEKPKPHTMKRKAARRLHNEGLRLHRKGFKLVKVEDLEMDDGDRPTKRMRASS